MMSSIGCVIYTLRMKHETRVSERLVVGLAPLQGSSPPLVNIILDAARYSLSVTPPKWLRVYQQSGLMPKASQHSEVQASQSKSAGQNISLTPLVFMGMAWSPQARMFHPLISSSLESSVQISLQAVLLQEQQYEMDWVRAEKRALSGEVTLTESRGMQEELAGQAVTFFRKNVGQGQFIMAMQEYAVLMYSIRRSMSWQVFIGLQVLNHLLRLAMGAWDEPEQLRSLLNAQRITLGQFWLCLAQFWVTIQQKIPILKFCLLPQQQIGADAA